MKASLFCLVVRFALFYGVFGEVYGSWLSDVLLSVVGVVARAVCTPGLAEVVCTRLFIAGVAFGMAPWSDEQRANDDYQGTRLLGLLSLGVG